MLISQTKKLRYNLPSPVKNLTFYFRTNNGTKMKIELKVISYLTTSYKTNSDSASPPIMIGGIRTTPIKTGS